MVLAAAAAALFLGLGRPRPWRAGAWKGDNVVVVTIDTLRADRLPAYGFRDVRTPAIDALAARGVTHLDMPLTPQRVWRALDGAAKVTT